MILNNLKKTPDIKMRHLPVFTVHKSTFYSLKIGLKKRPPLIHGSKTEKKNSGQIFHATIAYLKENSKIKDKFFKKILPQK